jgi:hypothetical protein
VGADPPGIPTRVPLGEPSAPLTGDCIARPRDRDEHHRHKDCQGHAMTIASGAALSPSWPQDGQGLLCVICPLRWTISRWQAGGLRTPCLWVCGGIASDSPVIRTCAAVVLLPGYAPQRTPYRSPRRPAFRWSVPHKFKIETASITPRAHARHRQGPVPAAVGPGQHRVPSGPKQSFSHTGRPALSHHA